MNRKDWLVGLALLAVVGVAAGYRLYGIQEYPPGLFPDEAANGEDALLILEGDRRAFYPRGNGREALFYYLEAASLKLFGIGVWQLHVVSAVVGILTVLFMYFATKPYFGRLAGLLAAWLLATSYWHVTLSRTGFRAILIPLFVAAFTAAVGYLVNTARPSPREGAGAMAGKAKTALSYLFAALAGVAFAGGFYTYIAYRVMVGVVLGILLLLLIAAWHPKIGFPHFRRYGKQLVVGIVAAILTFLPLGLHFYEKPEDFIGRAGQVSVFNPDLQREVGGGTLAGTILYSVRETVRSFITGEGDQNWRHSVPGYPLVNPVVGFFFLLGLAWTIHGTVMVGYKIWKGEEVHLGMVYPYILLLLLGMLLPVVTTAEGIPHGLRSVGLVVPIFMLAGTALAVTVRFLTRLARVEPLKAMVVGVLAAAVLVSGLYDGVLYFFVAQNDSEAAYAYRADLPAVAQFITQQAGQGSFDGAQDKRPYLVLDAFSVQSVHFLTSVEAHDFQSHPDEDRHLYRLLKPEMSHLTALQPGEIIIFTQSTLPDADRYQAAHGKAIQEVESRRNRWGQEYMRVYRSVEAVPEGEQVAPFDLDA